MTEHIEGEELEGGQVRVVSYASFDALMDDQKEQEEEARQKAHPEQHAITWGDYVLSKTNDDHQVYGMLVEHADHVEQETAEVTNLDEMTMIGRRIDDVYARGYRFGRYFSQTMPEGEWGTKHVVSLWKITEAEFNAAAVNGWVAPEEVREAINDRIKTAMPDDPSVQLEIAREAAIQETLEASAEIVWAEMSTDDPAAPTEDFMRGVVMLGMNLCNVDFAEVERWASAIRRELLKISLRAKEAQDPEK